MARGRISKEAVEQIAIPPKQIIGPDGKERPGPDAYLWDTKLAGYGAKITSAGKRVYFVQYRVGGRKGRTRRVTIGTHGVKTEHEARVEAKKLLGAIQSGSDPASERDKRRDAESFGQALERFERAHVDAKCKPYTAQEYRRSLRLHVPKTLRSRLLADIERGDVTRLHDRLGERPAQANRLMAILSKFFNWCEAEGIRAEHSNPCRHVQRYPTRGRERFLSADELARLASSLRLAESEGLPWDADERGPKAKHLAKPGKRFTVASPFVVAAIRLLIFTGARLSEILTLQWEHVNIAGQQLRLPKSKTGRKSIYLNAPAIEVLLGLPRIESNPYVICGEVDGAHLVNLQKPWRRIRKAAGLSDVRIHDLRHTFASWGAAGGLPLPIIGGLLAHSQPQTTQRYAHLSADPLKAATERVGNALAGAMNGKPAVEV